MNLLGTLEHFFWLSEKLERLSVLGHYAAYCDEDYAGQSLHIE